LFGLFQVCISAGWTERRTDGRESSNLAVGHKNLALLLKNSATAFAVFDGQHRVVTSDIFRLQLATGFSGVFKH